MNRIHQLPLWICVGVGFLTASAQLSLPEDYEAPIRPTIPDGLENQAEEPMDMDEGMRRMMDQMNARGLRQPVIQEPPDQDWNRLLEEMKQRFQGGPEQIRARVLLADGTQISGDLRNSSFFVQNAVGQFPIRLHEIERMQPMEGTEGHFVFELRGGDLLRGIPSLPVLALQHADGGGRIVRISHVVTLLLEMDAT